MTHMNPRWLKILRALNHGPLSAEEIAGEIKEASLFTVQHDLKQLRADRLVTDGLGAGGLVWRLVDKGREIAAGMDQLSIEVGR